MHLRLSSQVQDAEDIFKMSSEKNGLRPCAMVQVSEVLPCKLG